MQKLPSHIITYSLVHRRGCVFCIFLISGTNSIFSDVESHVYLKRFKQSQGLHFFCVGSLMEHGAKYDLFVFRKLVEA